MQINQRLPKKVQKLIENVLFFSNSRKTSSQLRWVKKDDVRVHVQLPEDETGIYIGHHGEGLAALQLLLSL